jgi:hypothetical protein
MARNRIQFQKGLSLREFQKLYGTEAHCEAALEKARWPDGFRCPRCGEHEPPLPAKLSALSDRSTRGLTMSDAIALRPRAAG